MSVSMSVRKELSGFIADNDEGVINNDDDTFVIGDASETLLDTLENPPPFSEAVSCPIPPIPIKTYEKFLISVCGFDKNEICGEGRDIKVLLLECAPTNTALLEHLTKENGMPFVNAIVNEV